MNIRSFKIKIFTLLVYLCGVSTLVAQTVVNDENLATKQSKEDWTLRLLRMEQNVSASPNELVFGSWNMQLIEDEDGAFSGSIEKDGWRLPLTGKRINDTVTFSASGSVGDDHWQLDWVGTPPSVVSATEITEQTLVGTATFMSEAAEDDAPVVCHCFSIKRTPYPTRPVSWKLNKNNGAEFNSRQLNGKPAVIVFSQGFSCVHCNEQIKNLRANFQAFEESHTTILVLVADTAENLSTALKKTQLPFTLLADPDLRVFKKFGLDDNHRTHGVTILDSHGVIKWASVGHAAEVDVEKIIGQLQQIAKSDLADIKESLTTRDTE